MKNNFIAEVADPQKEAEGVARRKYPRRAFAKGVGVLLKGQYHLTAGAEIGEGGIAFDSNLDIPEGSMIVLSFQIPGGSFIVCIGQVRNALPAPNNLRRTGCTFSDLKFDKKREIRTFVSARN